MSFLEIASKAVRFVGVSLMALITVSTLRIVCDFLGPDGERLIREAREKAHQS